MKEPRTARCPVGGGVARALQGMLEARATADVETVGMLPHAVQHHHLVESWVFTGAVGARFEGSSNERGRHHQRRQPRRMKHEPATLLTART